jgi:hypothetical protein
LHADIVGIAGTYCKHLTAFTAFFPSFLP